MNDFPVSPVVDQYQSPFGRSRDDFVSDREAVVEDKGGHPDIPKDVNLEIPELSLHAADRVQTAMFRLPGGLGILAVW